MPQVYITLTMALGLVALGASVLVLPRFLAMIGAIVSLVALAFIPATPQNLVRLLINMGSTKGSNCICLFV
jgi:hypothetical protein